LIGAALCAAAAAPAPDRGLPSQAGHGAPGDTVLPKAVPLAARRSWMARQSGLCLTAIAEAASRHGLPASLMVAISRVETGRRMPVTGERQPWPWTVNADGEALFFDTRDAAVAETARRLTNGAQFVDVGCMQVDLRLHGKAFPGLVAAFNPQANTDYAARLLLSLRGSAAGWQGASGLYHSGRPALADAYRAEINRMATQRGTLSRAIPGS
jgi:hypothetical protein